MVPNLFLEALFESLGWFFKKKVLANFENVCKSIFCRNFLLTLNFLDIIFGNQKLQIINSSSGIKFGLLSQFFYDGICKMSIFLFANVPHSIDKPFLVCMLDFDLDRNFSQRSDGLSVKVVANEDDWAL